MSPDPPVLQVVKLHTKLGKPIPSTEPVVVSGKATTTTAKPATSAAVTKTTEVTKVVATPKINFVGTSTAEVTAVLLTVSECLRLYVHFERLNALYVLVSGHRAMLSVSGSYRGKCSFVSGAYSGQRVAYRGGKQLLCCSCH